MNTNTAGESRGAILREVLETIYFGLREAAPDIATLRRLAAETLDDDAAIRGRFEGTGSDGVTQLSREHLFNAPERF